MTEHGYTVIYEALSEGGYQVIVPGCPASLPMGATSMRPAKWLMPSYVTSAACSKMVKRFPKIRLPAANPSPKS